MSLGSHGFESEVLKRQPLMWKDDHVGEHRFPSRVEALLLLIVVLVASGVTAIALAVRCPTSEGTPTPPTPPRFDVGGFETDISFYQSPALSTATRTLKAYLDARVQGSGADYYVGKCVRIGGWARHESLYSVSPANSPCPGVQRVGGGRITSYGVGGFARTGDNPMRWSDRADHPHSGDHIRGAPGRYSYSVFLDHDRGSRSVVDVVGPGVNRYGKRLPAVILGEFEVGPLFWHCFVPTGQNP